MKEFGMPQRTATDDANAGVVNPPAKQFVARDTVGKSSKSLSGSDKAMDALGKGLGSQLGGALSRMVDENTEEINTNRVIEAQARQGIETGMNEVDQVKKRTGWEKAIFGENIEYRAAQQRAVQNKVQASYLEDMAGIDGYAQETPEQFHKIQKDKNATILKEYSDDPDTRNKVEAALAAAGQKLATAHYKSHYAYNQLQQQEVDRVSIQQTLDGFNLEASTLLTTDAKVKQLQDIKKFFNGDTKREGKTDIAHRSQILDVVMTNMKAGNAGPMLAVQALGKDKGFSAAEQAKWDHAVAAYDADFGQKASLIRITADIQIESALTPEGVGLAVEQKAKDLDELFKRSSGSQQASLVIANGNLDAAQDEKSLRKQFQDRTDAFNKAQAAVTTDNDKRVISAMGIASENMKQAINLATTLEEKQAAIDIYNKNVGELVNMMSPELALILKKEKLDTNATKAKQALEKEKAKTKLVADKKNQELAEQAARDKAIAKYFETNVPAVKAGINRDASLTTKEKEDGFDTHLVNGAQTFIGGDVPPTTEEFGRALQTNTDLQSWVLQELKRTGETSPVLKTVMQSVTSDPSNFFDDDGNATDEGRATVAMADKLLQSDKAVALIGGKDAMRRWRITSIGVKAGSGEKHLARKLEKYDANKGKADAAGFSWKSVLGKGVTRREFMTAKLKGMKIQNPSEQMITDALFDYQQDLVAFGYDTKEADNSLWQNVQNNRIKIFSSNLHDAAYLNDATRWTAEDFIIRAEKGNYLAGKYADFTGTADVVRSHRNIPNLRWYTKPGVAGMFASSPSGNNELSISVSEMQEIEASIIEREDISKNVSNSLSGINDRAALGTIMQQKGF